MPAGVGHVPARAGDRMGDGAVTIGTNRSHAAFGRATVRRMTTDDAPVSPRHRRHLRTAALASLAVLGAVLAGCSATSGGSTTEQQAPAAADEGGALVQGGGDSAASNQSAGGASDATGSSDAERQVVKNGELYLTVDDPVAAADRVAHLAEQLGGRVDDRQQEAGSEGSAGSASMTIRVPAAALEDAVTDLGELGEVTKYTEKTEDVTGTVVDLDARISAAQASVERVQGFLEHTGTTSELLSTEQALSQRQSDLEQLQGQRAALADQVSMSTLYVSLTAPGDPVVAKPGPHSFAAGVGVGWQALVDALRGASVVLGVLLPWLVLGAILAAAVLVPARLRRRTRPPAPAEAAPPKVP